MSSDSCDAQEYCGSYVSEGKQLRTPPLVAKDDINDYGAVDYLFCDIKEDSLNAMIAPFGSRNDVSYIISEHDSMRNKPRLRLDIREEKLERKMQFKNRHVSAGRRQEQFISPVEVDAISTFRPCEKEYRFLVVDDNWINVEILTRILRKLFPNSFIIKIQDSTKVMTKMEQVSFDAVFLDIEMPQITGIELAQRIKTHEKNYNIPLIAVTSRNSYDDIRLFERSGFSFTLNKPLNYKLEFLLDAISWILTQDSMEN